MKKIVIFVLTTNLLLSGCFHSLTHPRYENKKQVSYTEGMSLSQIKELDFDDEQIKKYDNIFQKQMKHYFEKHNRKTGLTLSILNSVLSWKTFPIERKTDGDVILVSYNDTKLNIRTFDKDGMLFGWGEGKIIKKTKNEILIDMYDYRLNTPVALKMWEKDDLPQEQIPINLKYIWFIKVNKKTKEAVQFLYNADRILKNAQINETAYIIPGEKNLLIPADYMQNTDALKYTYLEKGGTPEFLEELAIIADWVTFPIQAPIVLWFISSMDRWN